MYRYITAFIVLLGLAVFAGPLSAQTLQTVSGYLPVGKTKVFYPRVPGNSALDTIYEIAGNYDVSGFLSISEGAEIWFLPNSRIVDSAGGKIIANGFCGLNRRILFRGLSVNDSSFEWGHFDILPNSDSAYFANVRFVNFRKRNSVDVTNFYSINDNAHATFNAAINNAVNGVGGVICTFSANTFIYDAIVDSCTASFAGGAFAFLQTPAGWSGPALRTGIAVDDGRLALANHQVTRLTIRDTKVINAETAGLTNVNALGGAIYMASNSSSLLTSDFVTCYLGYSSYTTGGSVAIPGTSGCVTLFPAVQDQMLFERCSADNTFGNAADFAKGGAIFVGSNTALIMAQATFNNDSAIETLTGSNAGAPDANAWGGAIAVSPTSGNPNATASGTSGASLPGLKIYKTATFAGNVAGKGGAIALDFNVNLASFPAAAPRLNIDAENVLTSVPGVFGVVRDSGLIQFNGNIAYTYGGAIYSPNMVFIKGYLAPQNFPWQGGSQAVELRVKFFDNVAGEGGGSTYLDAPAGGVPDIHERRAWHLQNSANPFDSRVNRGQLYSASVIGGGAEVIGERDSTFATEYNSNMVVGGNGGAVAILDAINIANEVPVNRYFVENEYNASNVTVARDTGAFGDLFPFDQRELTRFLNNTVVLGADSTSLYSYAGYPNAPHGRGGGLYVFITSDLNSPIIPQDSTFLSRCRFEGNQAYSGSAIWSDVYDLKIMTNSCLIANNLATSQSSLHVDLDTSGGGNTISNPADLNAGATIWADFEGSLPSFETNSRGDAIYDNTARYILRLPESLNNGASGTDTIRGNFWGESGPNVITEEPGVNTPPQTGPQQSTFFINYYEGCFSSYTSEQNHNDSGVYEQNSNPVTSYTPMTIGSIPDTLLMEGRVYDLFDKGTNMKVADYSYRRLAPAEAFSLGITNNVTKLHRFTRNIFDQDPTYVGKIDLMQIDFTGPQPIGYPLFLQADVPIADSNRDDYAKDYTVFMVFNQTTNEFVRVNLKETVQAEAAGASQQTYQGRLDFVPDSSVAERSSQRQPTLYTLSLLRPSVMTFAEVQRASMLEDSAALGGREYALSQADMMGTTPGDTVCTEGMAGTNKWYAGEKYHTLPVRPGDHILVISRTQLWKYGAAYAITNGLQFVIGDVTAPSFVADIPALQSATYNPNILFVHEDVDYDAHDAAHTLFRVAGWDPNNFYDPRFLFNPANYTQVGLTVTPNLLPGDVIPSKYTSAAQRALAMDSLMMHVRLNHWLNQTVVYNQNITGSNGYILLTGTPHNPDIVPGGESLTATVTNFPPNFASENGLKSSFPGVLGPDSNALSLWTFPPYMNCTSGFEPDTLCVRSTSSSYNFKIIVEDSLPRFIPESLTQCANLTDSLRYTIDLNTDDEWEDSTAGAQTMPSPAHLTDASAPTTIPTWDFRFGRTSYNFQTQPSWMVEPQGGSYVPVSATDSSFYTWGIINVRIDSLTAVAGSPAGGPYLLPNPQLNGELNLDTIVGVQADDGHTGLTLQRWPVEIHFVPTILTQSLPDAKEGVDYSLDFNNPLLINRIVVYNPNPEVYNVYQLLYEGQTKILYRDGIYHIGTGLDSLGNHISDTIPDTLYGHTPAWLTIDQYSGVLSGTPGLTDAPRFAGVCGDSAEITVIVTADCQLSTWKTIPIAVDSVGHTPTFIQGPPQLCVENHTEFCDSVYVVDPDLLRDSCVNETITITSLDSRDTVTPATITNVQKSDTVGLLVCGRYDEDNSYFTNLPLVPEYVKLQVTNAEGATDTLTYAVHIGDVPRFECDITVSNAITALHPYQDYQVLCFGAGSSGTDGIDPQYCEFEVPPATPLSAFDARWILPAGDSVGDGTFIDVRSDTNQYTPITWQVEFQPGNDNGGAGSLYPVLICWKPSCVDSANLTGNFTTGHFYLRNPRNPNEFSLNMATGQGPIDNSLYTWMNNVGGSSDSMCLQIRDQGLINALIVFIPADAAGVGQGTAGPEFALQPNYPNPFDGATILNFSVGDHSNVRIDIFDVKGTLVRSLVNEQLDPGSYPVTWDGMDASGAPAPDGSYIARMTAGSFTSTVKMSLERTSK